MKNKTQTKFGGTVESDCSPLQHSAISTIFENIERIVLEKSKGKYTLNDIMKQYPDTWINEIDKLINDKND